VKVKLGPVPVWFPNTEARRRAVRLHDLHHIATGYDTSLVGEAEIGAWELAAGCADYYAAWLLNATAVAFGLLLAPRRLWRALVRGRRSTSLYRLGFDDRWLDESVEALRGRLGLGTTHEMQGTEAAG
jgi:ubiquinone biosynthesis protein Coq4